LTAETATVGRESANTVCLDHPSISRRHCLIRTEDRRFVIVDMDSHNGTFVNGVPVKTRDLADGDEIRVGDYVFLFLMKQSIREAGLATLFDASQSSTRSRTLTREEATYLAPARVANKLEKVASAETARVARDLNALLAASETIHSLRQTEAIVSQILKSAFEMTPSQRGVVVVFDTDNPDEKSVFGWERESGAVAPSQNYQSIIDQVKDERATVLCEDTGNGVAFIGAPIFAFEKMLGVVVLQAESDAATFDENHLQLIAALGVITGPALEYGRRLEWMEGENRRLQDEVRVHSKLVGESGPMQAVYRQIAKVAPSDSTVLIQGESGCGKELMARAIHAASRRSSKIFLAINCATLSETLMESELFGHERGAFTGAIAQKRGKFEIADGGTVFLDEVGELAPGLQARLLRVLQEREFERIGGARPIRVDIRLIAATNRDLEKASESGSFRRDLYYRLNVISLVAPPLRERREDISLLARYFVAKYAEKTGRKVRGISTAVRAHLLRYDWPGNVRELENAMERAVVMGSSELIEPEDLPESLLEAACSGEVPVGGYHAALIEAKKGLILGAIEEAGGNHIGASKLLGINPTYLSRLIRNLNLKAALKQAGQE